MLRRKKCKHPQCKSYAFKGGFCKSHQSNPPVFDHRILQEAVLDISFYDSIWGERPHLCECCNKPLGSEYSKANFDHLLEKGKYPDLRYEKDNIALVCFQCHERKTRGMPNEVHLGLIKKAGERFKEYLTYEEKKRLGI